MRLPEICSSVHPHATPRDYVVDMRTLLSHPNLKLLGRRALLALAFVVLAKLAVA